MDSLIPHIRRFSLLAVDRHATSESPSVDGHRRFSSSLSPSGAALFGRSFSSISLATGEAGPATLEQPTATNDSTNNNRIMGGSLGARTRCTHSGSSAARSERRAPPSLGAAHAARSVELNEPRADLGFHPVGGLAFGGATTTRYGAALPPCQLR